ncbi:MAG: type II secretion system protein [Nitrospinae bacterium]|nr:type II secretion system protein [Nitrospinota bacterium]
MSRIVRRGGFTLIELIGVLAVIAILAGMILPNVINMVQDAEGDSEEKTLEAFARGLESYIIRTRTIPDATLTGVIPAWAAAIAEEAGTAAADIAVNRLKNPRYFVWETGTNVKPTIPYTQTEVDASNGTGATNPAPLTVAGDKHPRAMIVSSIGPPLTGIADGGLATAAFDVLWDWDGSADILNLTGKDPVSFLKVQRINLASLFFDVSLRSQPITQFGTAYIPVGSAIGSMFTLISIPANVSLTGVTSQCPNALSNVGVTTYTVDHSTLGSLIAATNSGTGATSGATPTAVTGAAGTLTTTLAGAATTTGNSIGVEVTYQATPSYQLATGTVTQVPPGASVSMAVIKDTPLNLYSNDGATILQTVYVAFNDSFWYTPGPPEAWGR